MRTSGFDSCLLPTDEIGKKSAAMAARQLLSAMSRDGSNDVSNQLRLLLRVVNRHLHTVSRHVSHSESTRGIKKKSKDEKPKPTRTIRALRDMHSQITGIDHSDNSWVMASVRKSLDTLDLERSSMSLYVKSQRVQPISLDNVDLVSRELFMCHLGRMFDVPTAQYTTFSKFLLAVSSEMEKIKKPLQRLNWCKDQLLHWTSVKNEHDGEELWEVIENCVLETYTRDLAASTKMLFEIDRTRQLCVSDALQRKVARAKEKQSAKRRKVPSKTTYLRLPGVPIQPVASGASSSHEALMILDAGTEEDVQEPHEPVVPVVIQNRYETRFRERMLKGQNASKTGKQ